MKRLAFLFSTTIVMLLVSGLISSPAWAYDITVRAKGTSGGEVLDVIVNNTLVREWTLTTTMTDRTVSTTKCGNIRLTYLLGGTSIQVDYIIANGITLQTEDQVNHSSTCSDPVSEMLTCAGGWIDFGTVVVCHTLSVSPTSLSVAGAAGSTGTFDVNSDTDWTVSSNQTWCTVSPTSGSNNGTVTVTAQANISTSSRAATVTVSGTGVTSKTVTVTQAPSFAVSPATLTITAAAGSTGTFNITTNSSWTASSNQGWLSVDPASGSGSATVTVTAQQNTGAARSATVTVSSQGLVLVVNVVQMCPGGGTCEGNVAPPYEIGRWQGFRTAAITYSFDDGYMAGLYNTAIPMFNEPNFNYKLTMYPVPAWSPPWSSIQAAAAQGHEVGSHTVDHQLSGLSDADQITELSQSQATINSYVQPSQCITIAYPGCGAGNQSLIAVYYIAGRTCSSATPNPATPTNFYMIQSTFLGTEGLNTISSITTLDNQAAGQGGWVVFTIHALDGDSGYSPFSSTILRQSLDYLAARRSTFWVSTFSNVARYIKERNNSSIAETFNDGNSITLSVTGSLNSAIYNYPITIRRPLPAHWGSANVTQNGNAVPSSIVKVGSAPYVMFDVVPNGGDVVLSEGIYGDFTGGGILDMNDLSFFFGYWLMNDCTKTVGVDVDDDCNVNFVEFAVLAENWPTSP